MRTVCPSLCIPSFLCLTAALLVPAGRANTYNLVTDYSSTSNPNGVWSYEVSGTLYPLSDGFTGNCGGAPGINCLYWTNFQPIPFGASMLKNLSGHLLQTNGTDFVPANYLNIDPQNLNIAIVFTAPSSASYQIAGQFLGNDVVGNPHPVSVTENGTTSLFSGTIGSYNQEDPFRSTVSLNTGDTVAFEVAGPGSGPCSFCFLSTGLWAEVTTSSAPIVIPAPIETAISPEPQMLAVLGGALAGLALLGRRKHS